MAIQYVKEHFPQSDSSMAQEGDAMVDHVHLLKPLHIKYWSMPKVRQVPKLQRNMPQANKLGHERRDSVCSRNKVPEAMTK